MPELISGIQSGFKAGQLDFVLIAKCCHMWNFCLAGLEAAGASLRLVLFFQFSKVIPDIFNVDHLIRLIWEMLASLSD